VIPCAPRFVEAAEVRGRFARRTAGFFDAIRRLTGRAATTVGATFFGTDRAVERLAAGAFGAMACFGAGFTARGVEGRLARTVDEAWLLIPATMRRFSGPGRASSAER
jgi:hypothetical protein